MWRRNDNSRSFPSQGSYLNLYCSGAPYWDPGSDCHIDYLCRFAFWIVYLLLKKLLTSFICITFLFSILSSLERKNTEISNSIQRQVFSAIVQYQAARHYFTRVDRRTCPLPPPVPPCLLPPPSSLLLHSFLYFLPCVFFTFVFFSSSSFVFAFFVVIVAILLTVFVHRFILFCRSERLPQTLGNISTCTTEMTYMQNR